MLQNNQKKLTKAQIINQYNHLLLRTLPFSFLFVLKGNKHFLLIGYKEINTQKYKKLKKDTKT